MQYDLAVIGAGWAGFNAALKGKALGLKVALIEKGQLGGTCLNRGCIPTKALLQSAKVYSLIKKSGNFGIAVNQPSLDFSKIQSRKEKIILALRQGMQSLLKGVDFINAEAALLSPQVLSVGGKEVSAANILISSGSCPQELPGIKFNASNILSSDDLLHIGSIPQSLLIIGGGVIGCEFASLFSNLGTKVAIIEKMPQLLPGFDPEISRKLEQAFKKRGITLRTNTSVVAEDFTGYEKALLCVGRGPVSFGLGLEKIGVQIDKGRILTDDYLATNVTGVYAAGDVTARVMLAHYAAYQGIVAAENIAFPQRRRKADNCNIPACVFTDPEIAMAGATEEQLRAAGVDFTAAKFDFLGSGMAQIMEEAEGFIKIIYEKPSGRILGAAIIGPKATELISTLNVAITSGLSVEQLRNTVFAHPTLSESIAEALRIIG